MFSNAKQNIPEIFNAKMKVDDSLELLVSLPIVELALYKKGKNKQAIIRDKCAMHLKKAKE